MDQDEGSQRTTGRARGRPRVELARAPDLQLLRIEDVCRLLCISKPTLWRLRRRSGFPSPTAVTERVVAWRESEIQTWISTRRRHAD